MATNTDTPRSSLTEHTPAGEPDHASRHIPIGSYTDDPAANARHSSDIADMINAPEGGFAGSVTAALFLRRFVPEGTPWVHFDTFAWRPSAKPGRPKGGDALGLRAAWAMLKARYGN